jgi:hypothetical protein
MPNPTLIKPGLLSPLDDFNDFPGLGFRYWPALGDLDKVTFATAIVLIVRMHLRGTLYVLSIQRMLHLAFNFHGHGLVSFVADHPTYLDALD